MREELVKKLEEAFAIEDIVEGFEKCENAEDAQNLFAQHGFVFSDEDILEMVQNAVLECGNGELDEDMLESVAGGGLAKQIGKAVWKLTKDYYKSLKSAFTGSYKNAFNQGRNFAKKGY